MTKVKSYKQQKELDDLMHKYVATILLSDTNKTGGFVGVDAATYKKLSDEQKKRLESAAFDTILWRLDSE
ncbi:hypothetical protein Hanom_Chr13g01209941 [Helianthus anomalus]